MEEQLSLKITQALLEVGKIKNVTLSNADFPEESLIELCQTMKSLFLSEQMLLQIEAPITIAGDIHGYLNVLQEILIEGGNLPESKYLFLGDLVDRGTQSIETIFLLFSLKIQYPNSIYIVRGNHECKGMSRIYGFYDECKKRYSVKLWDHVTDVFECMPIAAVINKSILCMHGGLSPHLQRLEQINDIKRPTPVEDQSLLCHILWNYPAEDDQKGWKPSPRGNRELFGSDVVTKFLDDNGLDSICRSHQYSKQGFEFQNQSKKLVSIFSASDYMGKSSNVGAIMKVDSKLERSFYQLGNQK